jgi:hypothetical protein
MTVVPTATPTATPLDSGADARRKITGVVAFYRVALFWLVISLSI